MEENGVGDTRNDADVVARRFNACWTGVYGVLVGVGCITGWEVADPREGVLSWGVCELSAA